MLSEQSCERAVFMLKCLKVNREWKGAFHECESSNPRNFQGVTLPDRIIDYESRDLLYDLELMKYRRSRYSAINIEIITSLFMSPLVYESVTLLT